MIDYRRRIVEANARDVVVCGGGPAGCAAALAARREGLSVLLIEGQGQLGGMATSGHVSHMLGGRTQEGEWVVAGLFRSLCEQAAAEGVAVIPRLDPALRYHPYGWIRWFIHGVSVEPFRFAAFLDRRMREAGVEVLLHTQFVDAVTAGGRITHAVAASKSGLQALPASAFVDATGDADAAARSGCEVVKGRPGDGLMAPATLEFHVDGVDEEALSAWIHEHDQPKLVPLVERLRAEGVWTFPYDIFLSTRLTEPGTFYINTSRLVGVDGTDAASLSEAMARGRAEVEELLRIMRAHLPGFGGARLKSVGSLLGVRESRRIVGDFVMTADDLRADRDFPDAVGYSMYGWDLPDPHRPTVQPLLDAGVRKGLSTPLPYRMMVPRPLGNLVCPGRAVSVERDVLGPVREIAPVMAMGEAAGVAAAEVAREGRRFADVDTGALRERLRELGCLVDRAALPAISPRNDSWWKA